MLLPGIVRRAQSNRFLLSFFFHFNLRWKMCSRNRFDSTMHLPRWEIARTKSVQYSFNIVSMFNYDVLVDYMRTFVLPESSHLWLLFSWFFECWSKNPIIDHTRLSQAWLWIVFELLFFFSFCFVCTTSRQSVCLDACEA